MKYAVPISLLLAIALILPMYLMLPDGPPDAPEPVGLPPGLVLPEGMPLPPEFLSPQALPADRASLDAFIREYEEYPFNSIMGTSIFPRSMRITFDEVYGGRTTRYGTFTESELPGLFQRSSESFLEQSHRTLLFTILGFLLGIIWTPLGLGLARWKGNQKGPYAHKGTTAIAALLLGGLLIALAAPIAGSRGEPASALLCIPIISFWVIYGIRQKRSAKNNLPAQTQEAHSSLNPT